MDTNANRRGLSRWIVALSFAAVTAAGCAGGPLTAREKGAGIGALGGAAAGGAIGAAMGRPGLGAAIGGGVGLGAGALIGDYVQGQDDTPYDYRR
jgi:phage tail tape-measure protein